MVETNSFETTRLGRSYNIKPEELTEIAKKNNIADVDFNNLVGFAKEVFQIGYGIGYNRAYRDILSSAL